MNKSTPIICGFSGTFKSTLASRLFPFRILIQSPTKFINEFNREICGYELEISSLTKLGIHLHSLELMKNQPLVIERSIYDYFFFQEFNEGRKGNECVDLDKLIHQYKSLIGEPDYIIIENYATRFIENTIIESDKDRSYVYKNLESYLNKQEEYLDFIKSHIRNYLSIKIYDKDVKKIIKDKIYIPKITKYANN